MSKGFNTHAMVPSSECGCTLPDVLNACTLNYMGNKFDAYKGVL